MDIKPMDDVSFDAAKLDPGIRMTVEWLRARGFKTTDSGDGKTKLSAGLTEDDGIIPCAHVVMVAAPDALAAEARRLYELLWDEHDIDVMPEGGTDDVTISASYDPANDSAIILLSRVDDSMLKQEATNG